MYQLDIWKKESSMILVRISNITYYITYYINPGRS